MTGYYLYEIAVSGIMDVIIFVPFGLVFYFLGKWWISIKLNQLKDELLQGFLTIAQDLKDEG